MRKTSTKKFTTVLFLFTMLYYLIGCGHVDIDNISSEKLNNATPQELVEFYYDSLSMEDIKTAQSCLSTDYAEFLQNADDSDFNSLKKITDIKVTPASPIKLHNENYDEVQVVAEYNALYKKIMTVDNGKQIRFVYVAKKTQDSKWKITSIGTGP